MATIRRIPRVNPSRENDRCEKHRDTLDSSIAEEDSNDESATSDEQIHVAKEAEIPFQDILADERRRYNPTQEYVRLMYNDLVKIFVKKWEGEFLRKTIISNKSLDQFPPEDEENNEDEPSEDNGEGAIDIETFDVDWKLNTPDEMVEIEFVNGNSYTGRISKQKMEGQGLYRWYHGSQYKGAFEDNKIEGKGTLEWQDSIRYDGDFKDGYYHGRGTITDKNDNLLYIGEWKKGQKHGKGYCRFKKDDSYDGDWVMDKRDGVGNRLYSNGARYVGDWKDGLRHGTGTMAWPNGDVYEGEWDQGQMHGYGKYTWNRVFKKSFCWPQETCYVGQWYRGTRDGRGQLTLNSIGGAKYSGEWKNNKKHGYGTIIGNNGDVTEDHSLFENNTLLPLPEVKNQSENEDKKNNGNGDQRFRITSILNPEQRPSLRYYTDRLFKRTEISSSKSLVSLISAKCLECEDTSCHCLNQSRNHGSEDRISIPLSRKSTRKDVSSSVTSTGLDQAGDNLQSAIPKINYMESIESQEERWTYNCIEMHMPRIRKIYEEYSKIFCDTKWTNTKLSMSRISLWQLWRDCGIHNKSLSLVQIDKYLTANKSTLLAEDPHCPYGRIEIWQLIHAFLEVSWHLCTKNGDIDEGGYPGRLANGLHKFLINHVYPYAGNFTGILGDPKRDLIPIHRIYQLYTSIGKPHTARQLLRAVCPLRDASEDEMSLHTQSAALTLIPKSKNFIDAEEKFGYSSSDECGIHLEKYCSAKKGCSFLPLKNLDANEFIKIMSIVCPSLKDPDTNIIINMEYELTFLEFLEIIIEAGKKSVHKKYVQRENDRKAIEAAEIISLMSRAKADRISRSTSRLSGENNSIKSRKKPVKNH